MSTPTGDLAARLGAVVINYQGGSHLLGCVAGLRRAGVRQLVVVDNGSSDGSLAALAAADPDVTLLPTGRNLGYGTAANRGAERLRTELLLVCNPDLELEPEAPARLLAALDRHQEAAVAGPRMQEPSGRTYPSARAFPSYPEAVGHAVLGLFWPKNPWSRRYRQEQERLGARAADWVSGACLLLRRDAFWSVGGFDEGYFMYVEDLDLCWRLGRAGWTVRYEPDAVVTHRQGLSTAHHPYRMLVAHHASTWRFARKQAEGAERCLLPAVGVLLAARLAAALAQRARAERAEARRRSADGPAGGVE